MLSSFAVVLTICCFAGTIIVVALAMRARADDAIARVLRVLYDTKHPAKTR